LGWHYSNTDHVVFKFRGDKKEHLTMLVSKDGSGMDYVGVPLTIEDLRSIRDIMNHYIDTHHINIISCLIEEE